MDDFSDLLEAAATICECNRELYEELLHDWKVMARHEERCAQRWLARNHRAPMLRVEAPGRARGRIVA